MQALLKPLVVGAQYMEAAVATLGLAILAIFGWAFSLNARISVIEQRHEDLLTLINSKFDDVNGRLGRIERALNGYMRRGEE